VLLVVAALIAALGTSLVFMYVRGVDARAAAQYDAVRVLEAVEVIEAGETIEAAQAAGKIQLGTVGRGQVLEGTTTGTGTLAGKVALTTIYPGEQIISSRFGDAGDQEALTIPDGKLAISVTLTDPARVAGFVSPGAEVAIFMSGDSATTAGDTAEQFTRLLLPRVQVIGVGTTTVVPTTTTDRSGAQTTERLPNTLLTLALDQAEAEKVLYAAGNGELAFALLTDKSSVAPREGVTGQNLFE